MVDTVKAFSDTELKNYIADLKSQGLSVEDLNQRILADAVKYNVSDSQISRVTGYAPKDIHDYAASKGAKVLTEDQAAAKAANDWAANFYGRPPTPSEVQDVKAALALGVFNQKDINDLINKNGTEAYNYDVQTITSAFRQAYGRNPTQAELANAYDNYRDSQVSSDVVQFNKYTPTIVKDYLDLQLKANPDNPDAAYKNVINEALQRGVTVDELASATGFSAKQIQDYATNQNLGNLKTYAAERAANPAKTFMELNTLAADPWGGRYATTSPYEVPEGSPDVVTLSNGDQVQFTRNVFDALDTMGRSANLRFSDVAAATRMAVANGTMSEEDAAGLMDQLSQTTNPQEGMAVLSQPKAFVVVDQLYGLQLGQAKTLEDAQKMAQQVSPYLDQAARDLGPAYTGITPSQFTVGKMAEEGGVLNYPYSKESVEQIYSGYNSTRKPSDAIDPNARPGAPGSWQAQVVNPIYKKAADIIDKNYNPYSMPTQQAFAAPTGAPQNPVQRGLDYISRLGNRMANVSNYTGQPSPIPGSAAVPSGVQQPIGGATGTSTGLGQAYQYKAPDNLGFSLPLQYNDKSIDKDLPMIYNIYTGTWARAPNNLPANEGMLTPSGPVGTTPPVLPDNPAPLAPVAAKTGGIIKKIKVPSGREHFVKQYKEGKISLKELSAKLKR